MKHQIAIKVPVIESERGWGQKIDDYMICLSLEDATKFVKEFNAENDKPQAPDWYMYADGSIFNTIDLTNKQMAKIKRAKNKRMWMSRL